MGCSGSKSTPTVDTVGTKVEKEFNNNMSPSQTNTLEMIDNTMMASRDPNLTDDMNGNITNGNDTMSMKSGDYEYTAPVDTDQTLDDTMNSHVKDTMDDNGDKMNDIMSSECDENNEQTDELTQNDNNDEQSAPGENEELNQNESDDLDQALINDKPPTPMPEDQVQVNENDPDNFSMNNIVFTTNTEEMKTVDSRILREMSKAFREYGINIQSQVDTDFNTLKTQINTVHTQKGNSSAKYVSRREDTDSDDDNKVQFVKPVKRVVKKRQTKFADESYAKVDKKTFNDRNNGKAARKKDGGSMFPCVMRLMPGHENHKNGLDLVRRKKFPQENNGGGKSQMKFLRK